MLRASQFLTLARLHLEAMVKTGEPITTGDVQALCDILQRIAVQCDLMEQRLAGELIEDVHGKVVSLADWANVKGIITIPRFSPSGGDAA